MQHTHLRREGPLTLGLLADLYHLTMAYGFWKKQMDQQPAVFNLTYRRNPTGSRFVVAAGLELVIDYLQQLRFTVDDIQYLGSLQNPGGTPLFEIAFLNYLQRLKFTCDIDAVAEGTIVFPHEPLVRVKGPLLQAQLIESALLNLINFSSLIATKAATIAAAAAGDPVYEFGLRRAQGIDGGLTASRAAFIGGVAGTSNLLAGKHYRIPVVGTHAHSWIMCFPNELDAFRAYAETMPNSSVMLVDTYDTLTGVTHAITVAQEMRRQGRELRGIRLDSGDLTELSRQARQLLDTAGFPQVQIIASDQLDEQQISRLRQAGAAIDAWGVGTQLVTGGGQAALGGVYKLAAIQQADGSWLPRMKLSEVPLKMSVPGILQVRRWTDNQGGPVGDTLYDIQADTPILPTLCTFNGGETIFLTSDQGEDLLLPIFRQGELVYDPPGLSSIQESVRQQWSAFMQVADQPYAIGMAPALAKRRIELAQTLHAENSRKPLSLSGEVKTN
ncbi:MAG: nicotinate phosphoribosyltransferase [Lewinellaceae bacterium]|nr:nicotinate phosphoribosyltransferase [Lewinellaceae bacterium]